VPNTNFFLKKITSIELLATLPCVLILVWKIVKQAKKKEEGNGWKNLISCSWYGG
jgi:hypothetical protein